MPNDKRFYYGFLLPVFILFSPIVSAIEVTIATGINDDPPYVYGDEKISVERPGVTIDILKLIEQRTQVKFNIIKQPWARVVETVKSGKLDGGFHFSYKDERKSFVAYPIEKGETLPNPKYSISNRSYSLYKLKGAPIRWTGENIVKDSGGPIIIGVIRGGSIADNIRNRGHQLLEVDRDIQLVKLLLAKRIDALVGLDNMIDAELRTLDRQQQTTIEKTFPAIVSKPYYIAFSKQFYRKNPEIAWDIWEVIDLLRMSGELADMFNRYTDKQQYTAIEPQL